jgi:hypothetical protein
MRFEFLWMLTKMIDVFWDVMPYSLVDAYRRFGENL